ncbi:MAG TPA: endonuclease/exonuclease/phosphatase family protein [Syntrophales bacterium]|nr:endonuclease/exonuclease/phosphatase family protein [Syntrophales bacterium]
MKAFRLARKSINQGLWPIVRFFVSNPQRRIPKAKKDFSPDPLPDTGLNLNVMSFNIRRGTAQDGKNHWIFRRKLVHEILIHYRPDVLGLQEALDFQNSEIRTMLPGYKKVGIGNLGGTKGLHNTIFYDASRFVLSEEGTFWFSGTPDIPGSKGWGNMMPRTCSWARLIEKNSQQAFYFYNTHLDHISRRSRKKSVISLMQHIHSRPFPDPFILMGDFNARERSTPIQYLKGKASLKIKAKLEVSNPIPLMDTFRVRYPNKRNTATFHGFRRYLFRFKLDYIFVPSYVRVRDAKIIQLRWKRCYPSDHFPLLADIDLPANFASSGPRSFFDKAVND